MPNAAAAPATVGGEPSAKTAIRPFKPLERPANRIWQRSSGKAGRWRRPASQETCRLSDKAHRAGCSGGVRSFTAGGLASCSAPRFSIPG